jgi:hypothetical protein
MNSQNYNPKIWADMTQDERNTYYIAEAYMRFAKSRGDHRKHLPTVEAKNCPDYDRDGIYPADKIRNHKNWQYFERVWENFKHDQSFDPEIYLESISKHLAKNQQIYPSQLATKKNIQNYKSYRQSIKIRSNTDDVKRVMTGITQTYKLISRKMGLSKLTKEDLYSFFNEPKDGSLISDGLLFCMQEMISPYYFSVSKAFLRAYKNSDKDIQEEIISLDRLKDMAVLVKTNSRIYTFVCQVFGDDIL